MNQKVPLKYNYQTMLFPETLFKIMILLSLGLMSIGAVALIVMLWKDIKTKKLW